MSQPKFSAGDLVDMKSPYCSEKFYGVRIISFFYVTDYYAFSAFSGKNLPVYTGWMYYTDISDYPTREPHLFPHNPPEIDPAYTEFKKSLDFTPVDEGVPA